MMGHNIRFKEVIFKIIPFTPSYLEQWVRYLIKNSGLKIVDICLVLNSFTSKFDSCYKM